MIVTRWTGVEVQLLRTQALRLTQKELAALSGFSLAAVRKWERRGPTITLASEFAEGMDTLLQRLDDRQRARFLSALANVRDGNRPAASSGDESDGVHRIASAKKFDVTTIELIRGHFYDLNASYDIEPSTSLLGQAGQHLGQVRFLHNQVTTESARRNLLAVEAQGATLMSRLVWDASQRRDNATANYYLDHAIAAAQELRDPIMEGQALLRKIYISLYGEKNPSLALSLTIRLLATAEKLSRELAFVALLHQAEAFAMMRRKAECEQALSRADGTHCANYDDEVILGIDFVAEYNRLAGSCYLFLGHQKRAQTLLEEVSGMVGKKPKTDAIIMGNLSLAQIRQRHFEEGAHILNKAIDSVEKARGGAGLNIVFNACRELKPYRNSAVLRDVYDRVLELMTR
ncbi:helix-turn-helix transcriptional regulator [Nocardia beijingensis]|uniref:helix-turn-helix domain-containing protein n=1 Tax=Nocardia beijingensis TaxID=95162 RepID=UPI0033F95BAD